MGGGGCSPPCLLRFPVKPVEVAPRRSRHHGRSRASIGRRGRNGLRGTPSCRSGRGLRAGRRAPFHNMCNHFTFGFFNSACVMYRACFPNRWEICTFQSSISSRRNALGQDWFTSCTTMAKAFILLFFEKLRFSCRAFKSRHIMRFARILPDDMRRPSCRTCVQERKCGASTDANNSGVPW